MVQVIAAAALILFSALMLGIGVYSSRHTKTAEGFVLGGRNIGAWMSAFAYGTSYFSAVIFVGYAGKNGWDVGFASLWIGLGNAVIGCWLAWTVLAKRTRRMTHRLNARTMPEFFEGRYLSTPMKLFAAMVIFIFLMPYAASVYKGLGALFGMIFPDIGGVVLGMPAGTLCMLIVAILTSVYLILGGYVAAAITDFVQGIIMILGVFVMVAALLSRPEVGGLGGAIHKLNAIDPALTGLFGGSQWNALWLNILLTSVGTWGLPQMVHKFYAVKDEASIRRGTIISTVFALIIGCGAYFVGTLGRLMLDNQLPEGGYDSVVPNMLMRAFGDSLWGSILLAVILLLVLSASMSTLSAVVLSSSSAVTIDLCKVLFPNMIHKWQMRLLRGFCLLFVAASFLFATNNFAIIVSIMSYSWGAVAGCFIGPFLWGLFSRRINTAGAWAGMLSGVSTVMVMALVFTLKDPALADGFYAAFKAASTKSPLFGVCAMGVSLLVTPLASLLCKPMDAKHIDTVFAEG